MDGTLSYEQGASLQAGIDGLGTGHSYPCLERIRRLHIQKRRRFRTLVSEIAENELRGSLKKLHADKRDIRKEVPLDNYRPTTGGGFVGTPGPIEATTPSVIMSRKEDLDKLEKAIDELKPEYREAIVLTKIDGLSYKEIAGRLGKSSDAVRKLVSRAMAELTIAFRSI